MNKLHAAILGVEQFIRSLDPAQDVGAHDLSDDFIMMSHDDLGTCTLTGSEAREYRRVLDGLQPGALHPSVVSRKAVEKLVQRSILRYLKSISTKEKPPEKVLLSSMMELRKSLQSPKRGFVVYHPLEGLALAGLPCRVGRITFIHADANAIENLLSWIRKQKISNEERTRRLASFRRLLERDDFRDKCVAVVEVEALDSLAARHHASAELELVLDIINFFSDMIDYHHGAVTLPGELNVARTTTVALEPGATPSLYVGCHNNGPLENLSLTRLEEESDRKGLGFSKASQLLSAQPNKLAERILGSLRLAGRATISRRNEEAFLLYAISLESLVLLEGSKDELKYRLRVRVAHLLGATEEQRKRIASEVGRLYNLRSSIVHGGHQEVADSQVDLIRYYCKGCIVKPLNDSQLSSFTSVDHLTEWFDDKILR